MRSLGVRIQSERTRCRRTAVEARGPNVRQIQKEAEKTELSTPVTSIIV